MGFALLFGCDTDPEGTVPEDIHIGHGGWGGTVSAEEFDMAVVDSSFAMAPERTFEDQGGERSAAAAPAVADVTGDGTPDVAAVIHEPGGYFETGHLHLLDGRTGELLVRFDESVAPKTHPAIGDIDGDGQPENVAFGPSVEGRLLAFEADGSLLWKGETQFSRGQYATSLADMDADGDVEIDAGANVADHEGRESFDKGAHGTFSISLGVDDAAESALGAPQPRLQ